MSSMIELQDFHWRYPSFGDVAENPWALKGIDLEIKKGEFFGITGPSGAGKTTTCKAIVGIIPHGLKIPFRYYNNHIKGSVLVDGELVILGRALSLPESVWFSRIPKLSSSE